VIDFRTAKMFKFLRLTEKSKGQTRYCYYNAVIFLPTITSIFYKPKVKRFLMQSVKRV